MTTKGQPTPECCMCGDPGFSDQLFQCQICHFRSQHRYCSNLYPKDQSYGTCNWCLVQKEEPTEKSPKSSNSSSSLKNGDNGKKKIKNAGNGVQSIGGKRGLQLSKPIKKQRSPESISPPPPTSPPPVLVSSRKRIITAGALEERLRRTKSENVLTNRTGMAKQGFRNKVRRYKLLDEVIS